MAGYACSGNGGTFLPIRAINSSWDITIVDAGLMQGQQGAGAGAGGAQAEGAPRPGLRAGAQLPTVHISGRQAAFRAASP